MILMYFIALLFLAFFSFGFVDANFPLKLLPAIFEIVHGNRGGATLLYTALITFLFIFYLRILQRAAKKTIDSRTVWKLIAVMCIILFLSFPAFSYDVFNYMATAKVTFLYKENPYIVMPVEIPNEPMLAYLHASNKVALYGPTWIVLTGLPYVLGLGNLIITLYAFKALTAASYLVLAMVIWRLSNKNPYALAFFALNPIVITETLVSAHNDVTMMLIALIGFVLAQKKHFFLGLVFLFLSIFVKGATLALLPVYVAAWWHLYKRKKLDWTNVWRWSAYAMLVTFFLTPLREELYAWYFIWPLVFIALVPGDELLHYVSLGFSLGLPLRFAPFVLIGDWGSWVPNAKKLISAVPAAIGVVLYGVKKKV